MKKTNAGGITLISLIITILVIMILIGVTEVVISDELFDHAKKLENDTSKSMKSLQNEIEEIKSDVPNIVTDVVTTT